LEGFDQFQVGNMVDSDSDGISDFDELKILFNPMDGDMDGDGIMDGNEERNINGIRDFSETDPRNPDTDGDGVNDCTEIGLTTAQLPAYADSDYIPDDDPATTTNPLDPDTDMDGFSDGDEDINRNGRVDAGESDPNKGVTISGSVVDVNSNPIPGLWVHAFDGGCGGTWLGGARTDSNGNYTMLYMPAGNVYVEACSRCDNLMYTSEWWTGTGNPGSFDCSIALNLALKADEDKTGIDFMLEPAGSVSGNVKDESNAAIPDVHVYVLSDKCNGIWLGGVNTDSNGDFEIKGLPEGIVYVNICPNCNGQDFVNEWYDGENGTLDCDNAVGVEVAAGSATVLNAVILQEAKEISGIITGDADVAGMHLTAYDSVSGQWLGNTMITGSGSYTLSGLAPPPSEEYRIFLDSGDTYYVPEDYQFLVTPGQTDINFTPVKGGKITGNVSGGGQNLSNVCVNAEEAGCGPYINGRGTDDNGNYSFVLPSGVDIYAVSADPNCNPDINFIREYWTDTGGDSNCANADYITVIAGADTTVNFVLDPGGSVSGSVLDTSDNSIPGLWVHTFDDKCGGTWLGGARTDSDGDYTILGMPSGAVYIEACPSCDSLMYTNEWWADVGNPRSLDCNSADSLNLQTEEARLGVNFMLEPAGAVSGTVKDAIDIPIQGLQVYAKSAACDGIWLGGVNTDEYGDYILTGLPDGIVYIAACPSCTGQGFVDEWYNENYRTLDCNEATPVLVAVNLVTENINFDLETGGAIQGDYDMDNDVDGRDIAEYILRVSGSGTVINLGSFASNFGTQ